MFLGEVANVMRVDIRCADPCKQQVQVQRERLGLRATLAQTFQTNQPSAGERPCRIGQQDRVRLRLVQYTYQGIYPVYAVAGVQGFTTGMQEINVGCNML